MPLYPYQCLLCNNHYDAFVRLNRRDDPQPCPKCNTYSTHGIEEIRSGHRLMTADIGFRMSKEGLLNTRSIKNDGIHSINPVKNAKTFGMRR